MEEAAGDAREEGERQRDREKMCLHWAVVLMQVGP